MHAARERGLVLAARNHAWHRRPPPPGLLHQRDRGHQDASADDQALLTHAKMHSRMRRTGNGWENAALERCFATPTAEVPISVVERHAAARSAVVDDIERCYTRVRLHSPLGSAVQSPMRVSMQSEPVPHSSVSMTSSQAQAAQQSATLPWNAYRAPAAARTRVRAGRGMIAGSLVAHVACCGEHRRLAGWASGCVDARASQPQDLSRSRPPPRSDL